MILSDLIQDDIMVLLIKMSILFHFLELFLPEPLVHLLFAFIHELGVVSLASILDAEDVLVRQENVDHMFSLFGVVD